MARIYGTIESLKSLRLELDRNKISQFNSVKEIKEFLANYEGEKRKILAATYQDVKQEYFYSCTNLDRLKQQRAEKLSQEKAKLDSKLADLQAKLDRLDFENANFLLKMLSTFKVHRLQRKIAYYTKNKTDLAYSSVIDLDDDIEKEESFIHLYNKNNHSIIENRSLPKVRELDHTRNILESCKNLIAGAIGENLVVKEVQKLPDDFVLVNDFSIVFPRPIFYKKLNQRIRSIQIDHLLITKAGVFIIETKNWSKESVNSLSLRSPVEQIERANFALYIYMFNNLDLRYHHWGDQRVPVRNLIVMINHKPRGQFKYVTVKLLNELNNYIQYFEPVLSDEQFERVVRKLT